MLHVSLAYSAGKERFYGLSVMAAMYDVRILVSMVRGEKQSGRDGDAIKKTCEDIADKPY